MHSRVWIGIVLIGVLGVVILGFLTKFAVDSNAGLRDVIRFKAAFAKEFGAEGFEDVSLRKRPGGSGYIMVLSCPTSQPAGDPAAMDQRIAEYFVENFPDGGGRLLDLSYVASGRFGCGSEEPIRTQEIVLGGVRSHVELREQRKSLATALRNEFGCRLIADRFEGRSIVVEVEGPRDAPDGLRGLAGRIEPAVRERFRVQPYVQLVLRIRAARTEARTDGRGEDGPDAGDVLEVRYDPRGREIGA